MKEQTNERIRQLCDELADTLCAKNSNYGDSAGQSPFFVPWLEPETGLWVRLGDKVLRLKELNKGEKDKVGESLRDTLLDTAGYALRLIMELDNNREEKNGGDTF